jgi:hypothetical protein
VTQLTLNGQRVEIDDHIVALVCELNEWGFTTLDSCGGHPEPRQPGQWRAGEWYVAFSPGDDFMSRLGTLVATLAHSRIHNIGLQLRWDEDITPLCMLTGEKGADEKKLAEIIRRHRPVPTTRPR